MNTLTKHALATATVARNVLSQTVSLHKSGAQLPTTESANDITVGANSMDSGPAVDVTEATSMILAGKTGAGLCVDGHLSFAGNQKLTRLPQNLYADSLDVSGCT